MNGSYPLKLPVSVKKAAQQLAKEDGVSLNQWISSAVAQKVGTAVTAKEFFETRGQGAKPGSMLDILNRIPPREPDDVDRLPRSTKASS